MASTRRGRASGGFASGEHRCVVREPLRADATVLRVDRTRGTQRRARRPAWHRRVGTGNICAQQEGAEARAAIVGSPKRFFAATLQRCERNGQERDATVGGNWFSGYERMTQLAAAMVCLLAGTLVSTRRGSATSAAKGANIGAASILCEAALQADAISAQAKALPCDAVKTKLEEELNSVPAEVWQHALKHSGRLGKRTLALVGNWTASGRLAEFCAGATGGAETRVCSAKNELDTCTKKAREAQSKVTEAVAPAQKTHEVNWYQQSERQSREAANAKNLCLGATMVYLCTGAVGSNPCFSKGKEGDALSGGNAHTGQGDAEAVAGIWPKAKAALCTAKTADRNIRITIARFWAQVRDRSSTGNKDPQFGECDNYAGAGSDKGCLEYATTNTTEVFWMKTLLDADDALHAAENALAAANRTLDDVTRLSENAQDKHEALVAALTRENGAQARDADEAPQSAGASAETATKGDAQRDRREAPRKDTTGEASNAETQSSTDSAHFGWLGVQLAAGMTTFAGRHAEH
ncbi:hypothetical protein, conserved in T. vivax [Trypanosoma vivax Y486]|uniref:Uncharacterized protein n=1 Tax=Trypanosoma vivax (strain Y486) TaxID=1055687 RepID=F9WT06_TRYVY|nr:hypothetical protein, conserved in T. vivax [Trypanosoma vivax Y486]|eukprot:CCD20695.1 hypothetical protein, conserved in T. vivax [Trypanosoma vivax Y486]